jgi:hypothetical protein
MTVGCVQRRLKKGEWAAVFLRISVWGPKTAAVRSIYRGLKRDLRIKGMASGEKREKGEVPATSEDAQSGVLRFKDGKVKLSVGASIARCF